MLQIIMLYDTSQWGSVVLAVICFYSQDELIWKQPEPPTFIRLAMYRLTGAKYSVTSFQYN